MLSIFAVVSCSDDDETPATSEDLPPPAEEFVALQYTVNPRAFALKFYDFIGDGAENVKRLDSDTIQIAINESC